MARIFGPPRAAASWLGVLLIAVTLFLGGCQVQTTAPPGVPAVLNVDGRGNPPITLEVNGAEVAHYGCTIGALLKPGDPGVPPLPWQLSVVRQSDDSILLTSTVDTLPRWLVLIGSQALISSAPVAGPAGPTCPVSP